MKATILISCFALLIGSAVGFIAGKSRSGSSDGESSTTTVRSTYRSKNLGDQTGSDNLSRRGVKVNNLEEAMAVDGFNERMAVLIDYFSKLNPEEFAAEADKLESLSMADRMMVGYLLFARWGEEDPYGAMSYTKTMGRMGGFVSSTVLKSWASKDPAEAASYYAENPNDFRGGRGPDMEAASVIAAEWALQDQGAAIEWALSLNGDDKSSSIRSIFSQMAADDPANAAIMLASITDDQSRIEAQNTIAREWAAKDWDATEAWISSLPAGDQAAATARALRGLSDQDYAVAASKISLLPEGADFNRTMESIADDWKDVDPEATAMWILQEGTEASQRQSIGDTVETWTDTDPEASYNFVTGLESGRVRDEAVSSFVRSNRDGDLAVNLNLAESITDEGQRARAISAPISVWMREDKDAATAYVNSLDSVSDSYKRQIIARASGDRRDGRRRN
ncbi:MAG: hypothetical protein ACSHX0_01575 [Akkermansiaceae bacterium]